MSTPNANQPSRPNPWSPPDLGKTKARAMAEYAPDSPKYVEEFREALAAEPNVADGHGSPAHWVGWEGNRHFARVLAETPSVDWSVEDGRGKIPLDNALRNKNHEVAETMVRAMGGIPGDRVSKALSWAIFGGPCYENREVSGDSLAKEKDEVDKCINLVVRNMQALTPKQQAQRLEYRLRNSLDKVDIYTGGDHPTVIWRLIDAHKKAVAKLSPEELRDWHSTNDLLKSAISGYTSYKSSGHENPGIPERKRLNLLENVRLVLNSYQFSNSDLVEQAKELIAAKHPTPGDRNTAIYQASAITKSGDKNDLPAKLAKLAT